MLIRTLQSWLLLLGILAFAGCRTTTESETKDASKAESQIPGAEPQVPEDECPVGAVVCSQEYSPVICAAASYDGRTVPEAQRLVAWGTNTCKGQIALQKEACSRDLWPSKLGPVQCVPDAGSGNCPPASVACPNSLSPSVCTANAYGKQDLTGDKVLKAWGSNACVAMANLTQSACRQNLNPKALNKMVCIDDPSGGECPPVERPCHEKPRRVTCKARNLHGKSLMEPMEAKAETACEAKQDIARQACKRSLRPSAISEIVCVFEK